MFRGKQDAKTWKKWIWTALIIAWMAVIFSFSAQPADESSQTSLGVGEVFARIFVPDFEELSSEEQMAYMEKIDHPVRKLGHASEYAVLGFLAVFTVSAYGGRGKRMMVLTWAACTLYAASDEFHQLFVPGRSGHVTDVMIDSGGVLVGMLAAGVVIGGVKLWRNKREQRISAEENHGKEKGTDFDENAAKPGRAAGENGI